MAAAAGLSHGAEVRLEGVSKHFGPVRAVDEVSLTVEAGEFFTLLGPSGSGKTTTLMMIAGFAFPSAGEILIGGRAVARLPPERRGLGMVFQNYAVFPHMTVAENVAFPLAARGLRQAEIAPRVEAALALVRLEGYGPRLPRQLSGGQQQRVALARALVFEPPVLLMDEPLSALDKKLREEMQGELRRIHRETGVTVVYVTHDQTEALTMSDRIAVMNHGRIEQLGRPAGLYDAPATRFVADFLGETNFIEGRAEADPAGGIALRAGPALLRGEAAGQVAPGDVACAAIRPEKLELRAAAAGENAIEGAVAETVYAGDVTRLVLALAGGSRLVAKVQNRASLPLPGPGERVVLAFAASETRIFPADAG